MKVWIYLIFCISLLFGEQIDNYQVDIKVHQSGSLSIKETIAYNFGTLKRHGIFRTIPSEIKYNGTIKDIGLHNFHITMDNHPIKWTKTYEFVAKQGKITKLKIGSSSSYITGKHTFEISYDIQRGVLISSHPNKDAIRYNIIGTDWYVPIFDVVSTIYLPNSLTKDNTIVDTYTGYYASTSTKASTKWLDNHTLQISVNKLNPYEGATVEISFDTGLVEQNGIDNLKMSFEDYIKLYGHWFITMIGIYYLWYLRKRYQGIQNHKSITVRYTPPQNLSILEAGLILDKHADDQDFSAAILELAQQGYLEIIKETNSYPVLIKTNKPTGSLKVHQRYLLEDVIFKYKDSYILGNTSSLGASRIQEGLDHINDVLYTYSVAQGYMQENPKRTRKNFILNTLLLFVPFLGWTYYSLDKLLGSETFLILLFFMIFGTVGILVLLSKNHLFTKIIGFVFALAGSLIPAVSICEDHGMTIKELILYTPFGGLAVVLIVGMYIQHHLGKYTTKGVDTLNHLLGLKEFIKRVKQDEIKRYLSKDPLYIEKLIPYAVLFGETKHWLKLYHTMDIEKPSWFKGDIDEIYYLYKFANKAMTPPQSSSSSSGYSGGGGFSGGGSGGGGGGSW